jgi:hypothetical protein
MFISNDADLVATRYLEPLLGYGKHLTPKPLSDQQKRCPNNVGRLAKRQKRRPCAGLAPFTVHVVSCVPRGVDRARHFVPTSPPSEFAEKSPWPVQLEWSARKGMPEERPSAPASLFPATPQTHQRCPRGFCGASCERVVCAWEPSRCGIHVLDMQPRWALRRPTVRFHGSLKRSIVAASTAAWMPCTSIVQPPCTGRSGAL